MYYSITYAIAVYNGRRIVSDSQPIIRGLGAEPLMRSRGKVPVGSLGAGFP